jgi:GNAT superfamily N-acetyltransferase
MTAAVERLVAERAPRVVEARVSDDDATSREWAERRGFHGTYRTIRSRLDLAGFDAAAHRSVIDRVEAAGFRVEVPDDRDRLYELYTRLLADVPEENAPLARHVVERQLDEADAVALVLSRGGTWAAEAVVRPMGRDGAWNAFTGVLPQYRGRGLARAIKVAAALEVARLGRRWIGTTNHGVNAPMLAVNRALGYRPVSTSLFLERAEPARRARDEP